MTPFIIRIFERFYCIYSFIIFLFFIYIRIEIMYEKKIKTITENNLVMLSKN